MATTTDRRYRWPPLRFSHNHRHFSGNITSTKQCKKASLYCNMDYLLHLLDSSDTQLDLMLLELSACLAGEDELCDDFSAYNQAKGTFFDGETRLFLRGSEMLIKCVVMGL
ncbi:uncharacterized protein LOC126732716 isoform X1 [Quercus robur]|uniref:uncharacterized protein LOC126732716 isoform X1 n=1 Tax=Quercus robur TaxID=38942 RepID=UPI0021619378|nr:uncharacterized protein LOC126732716 isoform X1 [Quercus robur]